MTTKAELLAIAEANDVTDVDASNTKAEIESALDAAGVDVASQEEIAEEEADTVVDIDNRATKPEVGTAADEAEGNARNAQAELDNAEAWKETTAAELATSDAVYLDDQIAAKEAELELLQAARDTKG